MCMLVCVSKMKNKNSILNRMDVICMELCSNCFIQWNEGRQTIKTQRTFQPTAFRLLNFFFRYLYVDVCVVYDKLVLKCNKIFFSAPDFNRIVFSSFCVLPEIYTHSIKILEHIISSSSFFGCFVLFRLLLFSLCCLFFVYWKALRISKVQACSCRLNDLKRR